MIQNEKPAMTPQQKELTSSKESGLALYKKMTIGDGSYWDLAYYEILTLLFSGLPGIAGLGLRSLLYPTMFDKCGKRPAIGRGVVIRGPNYISLGSKVIIDDYCVLDVHSNKSDTHAGSISIGDFTTVGRFSTIIAKGGDLKLGSGVNIGSYCRIGTQSSLELEDSVLIAAYCYIGPGNHKQGDGNTPLIAQEMDIKGGVKIGTQSWIGTGATILDGVTIGKRSIIGAHSLVTENIPDDVVVAGTPSKNN